MVRRFAVFTFALLAACGAADGSTPGDPPPAEADARTHWPVVPDRGSTMAPFRFASIVAPGDPDADALFSFGDAVGGSAWWSAVSSAYGLGPVAGHARWTGPRAMTAPGMSDAEIIQYILDTIAANASDPAARVDDHTLFLVYLPEGTHSVDAQTGEVNAGCGITSGYHTYDPATHLVWAVVERCPPAYGWTPLQESTQTASHEIAEAATDPVIDRAHPGWSLACATPHAAWECSPFALGTQGEIGDLCPETRWDEAGFVFTRVYSDGAARAGGDPCVPATPAPFFGVTTAESWYAVAPGTSVEIEVSGWSTGSMPAWRVGAGIAAASTGMGQAPPLDVHLEADTMGRGDAAKLIVTAPASSAHGAWVVVELASDPPEAQENAGGDPEHEYYVGVWVP